jgi:hypothetical protein
MKKKYIIPIIVDTGGKFAPGAIDTRGRFATGVNGTSNTWDTGCRNADVGGIDLDADAQLGERWFMKKTEVEKYLVTLSL